MFERGFRPKSQQELGEQIKEVEKIVNNEQKTSLLPLSEDKDVILNMPVEEIKQKYAVRYEAYLKLLREKKQGIFNPNSESELQDIRKWLSSLNSLDTYISDHKYGREVTLREQQLTVFEDLRNFVEAGGKEGYVKLPTGVGKTVLFTEFVEALDLKSLIVVPTKLLISQTGQKLEQFAPDLDVGRVYSGAKEHGRQVTVITYNSLVGQIKNGKLKPDDFDCVILDEVHVALSDIRQESIKQFTQALKIGFTATPEYSGDKKVSDLLPNAIHSMEIREAVEEGLLVSFSSILAKTQVDLSKVSVGESNGEYDSLELERAINVVGRNKAAVDLYKNNFNGKLAVAFCAGVLHATTLAQQFNEQDVAAAVISGEDSEKNQQDLRDKFQRGEIKVLCNADILVTGFDEPKAAVCLNLRPTRSRVVAEQRGGRVLRVDSTQNDKHAVVIDFIDSGLPENKQPILFAQIVGAAAVKPNDSFREAGQQPGGERNVKSKPLSIAHIPGLEVIVDTEEIMRIVNKNEESELKNTYLELAVLEEQVRMQKIRTREEYKATYKNHTGWPSDPAKFYKDTWLSWEDFLGKFLSLEVLLQQVRLSQITSRKQYEDIYKKHLGWPAVPSNYFKDQWPGWEVFLGKEGRLAFEVFQSQVKLAGIKNGNEYYKVYSRHSGWPSNPNVVYKDQWLGWGNFLDKESKFLSFEVLQQQVQAAGIQTREQYKDVYAQYPQWVSDPARHYAEKWPGWILFLGKEAKDFLSFEVLQTQVRDAQIKGSLEYKESYKAHHDWPASPENSYKDQWSSWEVFLGKEDKFLSFEVLQQQVRFAAVKGMREYKIISKDHVGWPATPEKVYKDQWPGWEVFLGKEGWLAFEVFQAQVRSANIKNSVEYSRVYSQHRGWPSNPDYVYKDQWQGWHDFLGEEKKEVLLLEVLQQQVRAAGIQSRERYREVYKDHVGWPARPDHYHFYKDQWFGWGIFLAREKKEYLSFEVLQQQVRLVGISGIVEYKKVYKQHVGWPSNPDAFYKDKWPGWNLFFGKI